MTTPSVGDPMPDIELETPDGGEAYTRVGNLQVGADGQLMTMDARPVLGESGPMVVPPGSSLKTHILTNELNVGVSYRF